MDARIQALQRLSDSAEGRMQALQVGNMMAAEQLQRLVQLRQLILAQMNAQNVYMAHQVNRHAQRGATVSEFGTAMPRRRCWSRPRLDLDRKYHSGFWAGEAEKKSPLWEKARSQCSTPDKGTTPNCRVVIAVDLTVRVVPVRQGDDVNERVRE